MIIWFTITLNRIDRECLYNKIHEAEHFFRWRTNKGYMAPQKRLLSFMNNEAKRRYVESAVERDTILGWPDRTTIPPTQKHLC